MVMPFLADRQSAHDATALITTFGDAAGSEAAARADAYRDVGNVKHFCRWRQIERLIVALQAVPSVWH